MISARTYFGIHFDIHTSNHVMMLQCIIQMHVAAVVHIQHGCNVNLLSLFELVKSFPALLSKIHCRVFINQNVQAPYWGRVM